MRLQSSLIFNHLFHEYRTSLHILENDYVIVPQICDAVEHNTNGANGVKVNHGSGAQINGSVPQPKTISDKRPMHA